MGSIIGGSAFGRHDSLVDTSRAVLLDGCTVVLESFTDGQGRPVIGLELEGRVNKTTERSEVLYLLNEDGAAGIVSEMILGLAARMEGDFLATLFERINQLPRSS